MSTSHHALRRQCLGVAKRARAILDRAEAQGRRLSPSECREVDRLQAEARRLLSRYRRAWRAANPKLDRAMKLHLIEKRLGMTSSSQERTLPAPKRWPSIRPTLLHEAGHVVAAWHRKGMRTLGVELEYKNGRPTGRAWTTFPADPGDAVVWLAGPVAERFADRRMDGLTFRSFVEDRHARRDQDFSRAEVATARAFQGPRTLEDAWRETVEFLRQHWAEVERVADRLAEAPGGNLDGAAIRRALER